MQKFTRTVADLYSLAEQASSSRFFAEMLGLLKPLIHFDGAVLGLGECRTSAPKVGIIEAHIYGRHPAIVHDYADLERIDPVTAAYLSSKMEEPLQANCPSYFRQCRLQLLNNLTSKYEPRHLLLFGDRPTDATAGRWLVCYRDTSEGFSESETQYLQGLWLHIGRAIDHNRRCVLDALDANRKSRATALLTRQGYINVADQCFHELVQREWPNETSFRLPAKVFQTLLLGHNYVGRYCILSLKEQQGYLLCSASRGDTLQRLTPAETVVAKLFSAGMSNREVAVALGVSTNTVRSQLTRLYSKLNVHNKIQLRQRIEPH
ncbi:MAG: helix-turn-helix transcriptional regulator [Burkholderiales bacterium]|nr:helix-turn-helix transcriptional regulator [Burkholderiales bacterium]